jgi:SPASM domain peptide maturase of grasp-with-spasm system
MSFLKIFQSCKLVKGYTNYLICDIQRNNIINIPDDLYEWIVKNENKEINLEEIQKRDIDLFDNISFLIENEFIFITDIPDLFPKIDDSFYAPSKISNAIIDISPQIFSELENVIFQLSELLCQTIEFRFFHLATESEIHSIINIIEKNSLLISSVGFILPFSDNINYKELIDINRVFYLQVYNSNSSETIYSSDSKSFIYYSTDNLNSEKSCGIVYEAAFTLNKYSFLESLHHNSCLHKKMGIDVNGNIKNCPSMPQSFGNIKDTTLEQALNDKDFKKYWNLTKDKIEICKDCEFRYICTDCRAYTERTHEDKEGLDISKPLKCGYDPYTGEWEEWTTNPLKEKAIKYYGMQELIKKN